MGYHERAGTTYEPEHSSTPQGCALVPGRVAERCGLSRSCLLWVCSVALLSSTAQPPKIATWWCERTCLPSRVVFRQVQTRGEATLRGLSPKHQNKGDESFWGNYIISFEAAPKHMKRRFLSHLFRNTYIHMYAYRNRNCMYSRLHSIPKRIL